MIAELYNFFFVQNKQNTFRYIKIVVSIIVVSTVLLMVSNYTTSGILSVKSDNGPVSLQIYPTKKSKNINNISVTKNPFAKRLRAGQYNVVASSQNSTIKQVVEIKALHTATIKIRKSQSYYTQPLTPNPLNNIIANKDSIMYTGADTGYLKSLNSDATIKILNNKYSFKTIQWYGYNNGVGLTNTGKLVKIPEFHELNTPSINENLDYISYSINTDGKVFYSDGKAIYLLSNDQYKKVYEDSKERISILNNHYLLSFTKTDGLGKKQRYETKTYIKTVDGKIINKEVDGYELVWSPNGKYLASSGDDGPIVLYDQSLNKTSTGVDGNGFGIKWLDDDRFLYAMSGQLFSYNIVNKNSSKVIDLPGTGTISAIYPSIESGYIYIIATKDKSGVESVTYKVGLNQEKPPDGIMMLSMLLPSRHYNCYATYLNLKEYKLFIYQLNGETDCQKTFTTDLQDAGLDINKFNFTVTNQ